MNQYRPEVYGSLFRFDINSVKSGKISTADGEIGYHRENDKIVYDTTNRELIANHLWYIENNLKDKALWIQNTI